MNYKPRFIARSRFNSWFFSLFFVLGIFLVSVNLANAATYYISTSGSDTNNGTSSTTPWAHHPWDLNAASTSLGTTLLPGDTVILKKGDVWWDCQLQAHDSGTAGNNIITTSSGSFGSGNLPVCSGSADTTGYDSGWTNDSGNIWHRAATTEPKIVVYNGNILLADTNTSPAVNKYYWSANVLYVNIGGNPSSTTAWRIGKRATPAYVRSNYVTLKDLTFEVGNGTFVGMVYIETHTGVILDGLTVRYGAKQAISDEAGGSLNEVKNCTLSNMQTNAGVPGIMLKILNPTNSSYHNNNIIGGTEGIQATTGSSGINSIYSNTIYGQVVYNTAAYGIDIIAGTGWSIHDNIIHDIGDTNGSAVYGISVTTNSNNIYLNTIYNTRLHGISLSGSASSNDVYRNTLYNNGKKTVDGSDWLYYNGGGGGVGITVNGTSANNNIYKNYAHDNYTGITQGTTGGAGNNRYYYNLVTNSIVNDMGDTGDTSTGAATIFYNNTIYHNPSVHNTPAYRGHGLYMESLNTGAGSGNAIMANNIIYSAQSGTDTQGLWIQKNTGSSIFLNSLKLDHNIIYSPVGGDIAAVALDGGSWVHYTTGTDYHGASGIQTLSSLITGLDGVQANAEIHSTNSDPLFVSLSDFSLQSSSPAINSGANLGFSTDYNGNTVPSGPNPDMGVFEFQDSAAPVTTDNTDSAWHNSNVTVTLSCNDGAGVGCAHTYYTTDGTDPTTGSPQGNSIAISTDGVYTIKYFSVDASNNQEAIKTASNNVKVDKTSPASIGAPSFYSVTTSSIAIIKPGAVAESGSGLAEWQIRRNGLTELGFNNVSVTTTTDSNLLANTVYTYDVKFKDNANNISSYGTSTSKYTLADSPTNFFASSGPSNVTLQIDSLPNSTSGLSGYYFSRSGANSGWIQNNSWQDIGLSCGSPYTYAVKYRNGDGVETDSVSTTISTVGCNGSSMISLPVGIGTGARAVAGGDIGASLNIGEVTESGVNVLTYINSQNIFNIPESSTGWQSGNHSFQITDLDLANYVVTIVFHSTPKSITLKKGESQDVDLDGDKINDMQVTFVSTYVNRAEITIKSLIKKNLSTSVEITKTEMPKTLVVNNVLSEKKFKFKRNFQLGDKGEDVRQLQILLNKKGFIIATKGLGSVGKETSLFGPGTKKALIRFQKKYDLKPYPGSVGPLTLKVLNSNF